MKRVDGDEHAFGDRGRGWSGEQYGQFYSYIILNALIIAVGVGIVILGNRFRASRAAKRNVVAVH